MGIHTCVLMQIIKQNAILCHNVPGEYAVAKAFFLGLAPWHQGFIQIFFYTETHISKLSFTVCDRIQSVFSLFIL